MDNTIKLQIKASGGFCRVSSWNLCIIISLFLYVQFNLDVSSVSGRWGNLLCKGHFEFQCFLRHCVGLKNKNTKGRYNALVLLY